MRLSVKPFPTASLFLVHLLIQHGDQLADAIPSFGFIEAFCPNCVPRCNNFHGTLLCCELGMTKSRQIEIEFLRSRAEWDFIARDEQGIAAILQCKNSSPTSERLDALALRAEFLHIKDAKGLQAFLARTGPFESNEKRFSDLGGWQSLIRALLCAEPKNWAKVAAATSPALADSLLRYRNQLVHLPLDSPDGAPKVHANSTLDAIIATLLVDYLNGVRYGMCARKDCGKLYRMTTKRRRIFCSQYCGHLVSLRKKRSAKQARKSTTSGRKTR